MAWKAAERSSWWRRGFDHPQRLHVAATPRYAERKPDWTIQQTSSKRQRPASSFWYNGIIRR